MTTTKAYDFLNRLTSIASAPAASGQPTVVAYAYQLNNANQRTRVTLADGSYWLYDYDPLGQVRSGRRYWSDGTPLAGQQFEYAQDYIGNRSGTKAGGDERGGNLRSAGYTADALNRYSSRAVPGAVDVMGLALGTSSVTVNSQSAYREGEYFRKELAVSNGSVPVWQSVSVAASGETTVSGNVFVPKTAESFDYDDDGNLTSDGRWNYTWDAENRLIQMVANTDYGPQQMLKFEYDWQGRRITKKVWGNTSGSGDPDVSLKFVYDGWNLLAELDGSNLKHSFAWGLDLSGSLQGAGGVGGLLEVVYYGSQTTNCFVGCDGNGNVAVLVNAADGKTIANYEYGPFGETIRCSGPMGKFNPCRFSTKYQDDETDFLYYGYRYYNSSTGRWLSRDPIDEVDALNLYILTANNPISSFDVNGKQTSTWMYPAPAPQDIDPAFWLGWARVPDSEPTIPGTFITGGAYTDFREYEEPGLDKEEPCCLGIRYVPRKPVAMVRIYLKGETTMTTQTRTTDIVTHEFRHVSIFAAGFRQKIAFVDLLAPLCLKRNCDSFRREAVLDYLEMIHYRANAENAMWHVIDNPRIPGRFLEKVSKRFTIVCCAVRNKSKS